MYEFCDSMELFIEIVDSIRRRQTNLSSSLDEIVLKASKSNLAYIDNRRDAKEKYGFDFWEGIKRQFSTSLKFIERMKEIGIEEHIFYSKSEQFPDFVFKVKKKENKLTGGSLLELKDSKGGNIASFNSTLPTKYKTLDEVDVINGNNLVSRITSIMDGELASDKNYHTFQRRNFYLVRTHKDRNDKVKISIVDGSFFETVPKEHLIYQMFLNILRGHLERKKIKIPPKILSEIEKSLSHITDQTIIEHPKPLKRHQCVPV